MNVYLTLAASFALIGLGAYGGGLVTIPLIQHELVDKLHWLKFDEMASIIAIAQMTPGPIAVNAATFVGYRVAGPGIIARLLGAAVATTSVILPSIAILAAGAPSLDRISKNKHVQKLRYGLSVGVLSLIIFATWTYGRASIGGLPELTMAVGALAALIIFEGKLHPMLVILAGGLVGLVIF